MTLQTIIAFILGVVIGYILFSLTLRYHGVIKIDPEKMTICTFEIDMPIEKLAYKHCVKIKVQRISKNANAYNVTK